MKEMRYLMFTVKTPVRISKEERDKMFIPFYPVPESTEVANVPSTIIGLNHNCISIEVSYAAGIL